MSDLTYTRAGTPQTQGGGATAALVRAPATAFVLGVALVLATLTSANGGYFSTVKVG